MEVLTRVVAVLERLGVSYHLGGSLASSFHGVSRMTADVDIVIDADRGQLDLLAEALASDFYVSQTAMAEALAERRSFNAILLTGPYKVDFFVRGTRPFDVEEFRRAEVRELAFMGALRVRIKTAEDLILRKLEWFRLGGETSERQWSDVLGVLRATGGRLDEAYLNLWAREIHVEDLLESARHQSAQE